MRGEISSARHSNRHPLDWYVDPQWCAGQLRLAMGGFEFEFERDLAIWDPCCGMGNTLVHLQDAGQSLIGSDVVRNLQTENFEKRQGFELPEFILRDFFEFDQAPAPCSIVCNPPYSYQKGIAERFARHAIELASKHVCILMPSKWLAAQTRYSLFTEFPPLAVLHLCQRPSMPPGDRIVAMGNRAFSGGMTDYCWIVWDVSEPTVPGATRTVWLPPLDRNSEIRPIWEKAHA